MGGREGVSGRLCQLGVGDCLKNRFLKNVSSREVKELKRFVSVVVLKVTFNYIKHNLTLYVCIDYRLTAMSLCRGHGSMARQGVLAQSLNGPDKEKTGLLTKTNI